MQRCLDLPFTFFHFQPRVVWTIAKPHPHQELSIINNNIGNVNNVCINNNNNINFNRKNSNNNYINIMVINNKSNNSINYKLQHHQRQKHQ
jgi:hypothetical protein